MNRDGISVERVHDKDVELLRLASRQFGFQFQAGVAFDDLHLTLRASQERKVVSFTLRNADHKRIDLVKTIRIARLCVGSQSAHAQPDHTDSHRLFAVAGKTSDRLPDAALDAE